MINIFDRIINYFSKKNDYIEIFSEQDVRIEGWFKGELLKLFISMENIKFEREFKIAKKNIDFMIKKKNNNNTNLIEIKTLCISKTKTRRNLNFYFREKDQVGIFKDFIKLNKIKDDSKKYVIGFVYPFKKANNLNDDLNNNLKKAKRIFPEWKLIKKEIKGSLLILIWKRQIKK